MHRTQRLWTEAEDSFLTCPIPAAYLAAGALRGRSIEAIRYRRRQLLLRVPAAIGGAFNCLPDQHPGRKRYELADYPGTNWNQSLSALCEELSIGTRVAWRLRREALDARPEQPGFKPRRRGRRSYRPEDFPGVDWAAPSGVIMEQTGLSRPTVCKLRRRYTTATSKIENNRNIENPR